MKTPKKGLEKNGLAWLPVGLLDAHEANRDFPRAGEAWEKLRKSVRERGIITPLLVRPLEGCYQVVCGCRRRAVAEAEGLEEVPCVVREMTDQEALEILLVENMERENPNPVDEARLLRRCVEAGADEAELAVRIARSCEWVRQRQLLLHLGDEVIAALRLPADDERHLGVGAAQVLLEVPEEHRPRAIQLVLHPDWKAATLTAREARQVVETVIVKPHQAAAAWKQAVKKLVAAWRKRLAALLDREDAKLLEVRAGAWAEKLPVARPAEELLSDSVLVSEAGEGKRWLDLAVKHGLPVWVMPTGEEVDSQALVASGLLLQGEESCAEHGMECWVATRAAATAARARARMRADESDEGPAETRIDQRMDARGVVDLTPVYLLLASATRGQEGAEEWWPEWARRLEESNDRSTVVEVTEWVLGLKGDANAAMEATGLRESPTTDNDAS